MRITGGKASGIEILSPNCDSTRPVLERSRISLFSSLGSLENLKIADLFAGSGIFGFEAASRGASEIVFVEKNFIACKVISNSIQRLSKAGLETKFCIKRSGIAGYISRNKDFFPDLIFVDPPYTETSDIIKNFLNDFHFANFAKLANIILKTPDKFDLSPIIDSKYGEFINRRRFGGTDFIFIKITKNI